MDPGKYKKQASAIREQRAPQTTVALEVHESKLQHHQYQLVHVLANAPELAQCDQDTRRCIGKHNHTEFS